MVAKSLKYLLLLLCVTINVYGNDIEYGLNFNSKNVRKEKRTSFSLTKDDPLTLNTPLVLKFDFAFQKNKQLFGYILRIILNDTLNIDILTNRDETTAHPLLYVVSKDSILLNYNGLRQNDEAYNDIKLTINPQSDLLSIEVNGLVKSISMNIPDNSSCEVLFGANYNKKFYATDVAPIRLKDLSLQMGEDQPYLWRMAKHGNSYVLDENQNSRIDINDGSWELDSHTVWHNEFHYTSNCRIHSVFDDEQTFYFVTRDSVASYDLISNEEAIYSTSGTFNTNLQSTSVVYDHKYDKLRYFNYTKGEQSTSLYSFDKQRWNPEVNDNNESSYLHSNLISSKNHDTILQLFGYGFFRYKSAALSFSDNNFVNDDLSSQITPRYLASAGVKADSVYIFGGIGNKTGNQELGVDIYNDLYIYDFKTKRVKKVWDMTDTSHSEVAAKNIVITSNDPQKGLSLFFTPLHEKSYLILKEINLEKPEITTPITDTLRYNFHDIHSEAQLFYVEKLSKLYAVVSQKSDNGYDVNVFSIGYPVLNIEDVLFIDENEGSINYFIVLLFIFLVLILLYFGIKRFIKRYNQPYIKQDIDDIEPISLVRELKSEELKRQPGIYLLGGFSVVNREYADITKEFTPIMKQLLALIIIFTQKNGKGISNSYIKDYLWFDKSETSAQNNRNVNISKIRNILLNVGGFTITNNNSYWHISHSQSDYCDYLYAHQTFASISDLDDNMSSKLLVDIANFGELLPNQNVDFFDQPKAEYSDLIISVAYKQIKSATNHHNKIALASTILLFDKTDEEAIKVKCKSLAEIGKNGIAKITYDNFVKEYKTLYDSEYPESFEHITK